MPERTDDGEVVAALAPAQFAQSVLRAAARPERIASVVAEIIGDRVETGPTRVGPVGLVVAVAEGWPGVVRAFVCDSDGWDVGVEVPVMLRLRLSAAGAVARFAAAVTVRMRIALVPESPCTLLVHTEDVGEEHIETEVLALDGTARLITRFGDVAGVITRHVLAYLQASLVSPEVLALRRIDVAELIDRAWEAGLVTHPASTERGRSARRGA